MPSLDKEHSRIRGFHSPPQTFSSRQPSSQQGLNKSHRVPLSSQGQQKSSATSVQQHSPTARPEQHVTYHKLISKIPLQQVEDTEEGLILYRALSGRYFEFIDNKKTGKETPTEKPQKILVSRYMHVVHGSYMFRNTMGNEYQPYYGGLPSPKTEPVIVDGYCNQCAITHLIPDCPVK